MTTVQWNPTVALKMVADTPDTLRPIDVERLADICGVEHWPMMREWLRQSYPIMCQRVRGVIESTEPHTQAQLDTEYVEPELCDGMTA